MGVGEICYVDVISIGSLVMISSLIRTEGKGILARMNSLCKIMQALKGMVSSKE